MIFQCTFGINRNNKKKEENKVEKLLFDNKGNRTCDLLEVQKFHSRSEPVNLNRLYA
jgi:hypothetical protein